MLTLRKAMCNLYWTFAFQLFKMQQYQNGYAVNYTGTM